MSNSQIDGIVSRLAEILQTKQVRLSELEDKIAELTSEERDVQLQLERIETTRRTLLDLQSEI